jgi:3-hydroxyacyl-[acyl-carrier-protein] dehydratase
MRPVEELLPHRPPFLFLDEIMSLGETEIVAKRTLRAEEPHFGGHYPGNPIMPGVLLCEAVLQAGCVLMTVRGAAEEVSGVPVVARISDAKFKKITRPGDVLEIRASYDRTVMGAHFMKGTVKVGGKIAASLSFTVMLAPPEGSAGEEVD